jgi:hypothetical protein
MVKVTINLYFEIGKMREIKSVLNKIGTKIPESGEKFTGATKNVNFDVLFESFESEPDRIEFIQGKKTKIYKSKMK